MATIRTKWWPGKPPRLASGEVDEEAARAAGMRCAWVATMTDQTGKRQQRTFKLRKHADAWMVGARKQVQDGVYTPESSSITIAEAIDRWLERAKAEGLEHGTQIQYTQHRRHVLALIDGKTKLVRLSPARIEQFRLDLLKAHKRPTAKKVLASFKAVLRYNKVSHLQLSEITIGANGRHDRKLKVGVDLPDNTEFRALVAAATDPKSQAMIRLAGLYGLRASELRGLPWSDLDLSDARKVTITQRADAWGTIGSPKSESAQRSLELDPDTVRILQEWRRAQPPGRKLVFGTSSDRPDMLGNLQERVLDKIQLAAGIVVPKMGDDGNPVRDPQTEEATMVAKYSWHALRHHAITSWLVSGRYDMKDVQTMAGHATLALTIDRYGHFVPKKDAHARAGDHAAALLG